MPVLDTNLLIRLAKGDPSAKRAIVRLVDEELVVPAQVASEYLVRAPHPELALTQIQAAFHLHHTTDEHLLLVSRLARDALDAEDPPRPRWADLHIAATALRFATYVVTTNKRDFRRLGVNAWHYLEEADPPPETS